MSNFSRRLRVAGGAVLLALLAACASTKVGPGQYKVQPGDTLSSIARKHNQSVSNLMRMNKLSDPNRIEKDQILQVGNAPASRSETSGAGGSGGASSAGAPVAAPAPARPTAPRPSGTIPLAWPADGTLVTRFGGASKGIEIANAEGSPVNAAANGTVAYAGNALRGYGNLVILRHDKGVLTIYAHNRTLLVKEGQSVKQGDRIAEMGQQGGKAAALYFEVRASGSPADPLRFMPPR